MKIWIFSVMLALNIVFVSILTTINLMDYSERLHESSYLEGLIDGINLQIEDGFAFPENPVPVPIPDLTTPDDFI
jgi:hypothetical protein